MLSLIKAVGKYFSKKDNMTMVRKRHQLIPTRDIDDKRTLYYDWTRGTPAHTQPIVVLSVLICVYLHPENIDIDS